MKQKLLTAREVAILADMSPDDVLKACRRCELHHVRHGRYVKIPENEAVNWAELVKAKRKETGNENWPFRRKN